MLWCEPVAGVQALQSEQGRRWLDAGLVASDVAFSAEDVIARVGGGEWRVVYVAVESEPAAVVVLEITWTGEPSKKTLGVISAGGERMYDWLGTVQRALREIAAAQKCEQVIVAGRPGWEKSLKGFGWKKAGVIMRASVAPSATH
jgi:hypothetical protein